MSDGIKVFLAFASIIGGVVLLLYFFFVRQHLSLLIVAVLLIAEGAIYLWMNRRFYKR